MTNSDPDAQVFIVTRTMYAWAVIDTRTDDAVIEFDLFTAGKAAAKADADYRNRHAAARSICLRSSSPMNSV